MSAGMSQDTAGPLPLSAVDERADQHLVAMRDGVRLATDVYLPRTRSGAARAGRWPTVLIRVPYDKGGPIAFLPQIAAYLVDRGYAVVVQDVRGKALSEGAVEPFVHETADGYDTIDWIIGRAWSDGTVGMIGDSYYGYTQWAAAVSGHPALRAIVPRVTSTRIGADWMYQGGAFCLAAMVDWAATTWIDANLYDYRRDWAVRPLANLVGDWLGGRRSHPLEEWMRHPPGSPYWTKGPLADVRADRIRIPALHLGGWWDVFRRGQVADWSAARAAGRAPQHLVLSATDHQSLEAPGSPGRAWNYLATPQETAAFLPTYLDDAVAFLDRYVRGVAGGPSPVVRYQHVGIGWRSGDTWPPRHARPSVLWPADPARAAAGPEGGALVTGPETTCSPVDWVHDPADLVPCLVDDVWTPLLNLPDERDVQVRADVLTFTTDALRTPLDLAGPQHAVLDLVVGAAPAQVVAKLVHVFPDGYARRIAEGAAMIPEPPGGTSDSVAVEVDFGDTAYRVPVGHRLRLEVAASQFPRYLPVLRPGADQWTALPGEPVPYRLLVGGRAATRLVLSVVDE